MIIDTDSSDLRDRKVAALRGDTRDKLDNLLLQELMGTGIGRSAFILASIDHFRAMSAYRKSTFTEAAQAYEAELPQ